MFKSKWFVCCGVVWLGMCSPATRADVTYIETETAAHPGGTVTADFHAVFTPDQQIDTGTGEPLTVIRMAVTPAPEPVPALRHRFVARDIDLKSGNAAPFYYRALMELPRRMEATRKKYNEDEKLSKWYGTGTDALPVDQLPLEEVRDAVQMTTGDAIMHDLTEAIKRRDCDWQLGFEEIRGVDVISFRLPEFQHSREIARVLSLRTRLAIAERRYDDAIDIMRMNYRLGRDVAKPPLLVCGLIGIAISAITNGTLIDLMAAPDSPNLYWALTELPEPPIDMRPAARFELDFGARMFPLIRDAESTQRSPQEWNRLFTQTFRDLQQALDVATFFDDAAVRESDALTDLAATGIALLGYTHAKQQLIAQGMDRERVEKMAVGQVLAIYSERNYQRFANDFEKLWYVPFWEMQKYSQIFENRLRAAHPFGGGRERGVLPLVQSLMPAMHAARTAQVRLERNVAALRVIEALRMHAAAHDGRLPERLEDVDLVPVPLNPATGKPFVYRLEDATAILELPSADGIPNYNRRFEIQIAGKDK